jgi:hypothetical protein
MSRSSGETSNPFVDAATWNRALRNLYDSEIARLAPEMGIRLPRRNTTKFWIAVHQLRYQSMDMTPEVRDASQFWLARHGVNVPPVSAFGACTTAFYTPPVPKRRHIEPVR